MDGFLKFRWIITCGVIILAPLVLRSAGHPNTPLTHTSIEAKLTHTPSLEDLEYVAYSLDVVRRIPIDAASVLGVTDKDPTELQIEFALGAFHGLGSLLKQDLSDQSPEYLTALSLVLEQTESLLTSVPFLHLTVLFNFFHPTDKLHTPGSFEDTPILSPLQAPQLSAQHIDFGLVLLHRTLEDLHTALILPEAKSIVEFMIQADSQNTHKLASFGYELTLLTYLVLGNISEKWKTDGDTLSLELRRVLAKARNTYGPSFMRAPFIFENLALRTTQPNAAHIQTEVSSCLKLGKTNVTDLVFTPDTAPLSLDGSMAILQFLTDPNMIRDSASFTNADPDWIEKTLEQIWHRYRDDRAPVINLLCTIHPQKPELKSDETEYAAGWCISDYQPGAVIELLTVMALIEHFTLQTDKTTLDTSWTQLDNALSAVLAFLKQNPTTPEGITEKSPWELLIEGTLLTLQSTLAANYSELLDGDYTYGLREQIEAQQDQAPIFILSDGDYFPIHDDRGKVVGTEWRESNANEQGLIPYLKVNPETTQRNLLTMLIPDAILSDTPADWQQLAEPLSRLLEIWLSPSILGHILRTTTERAMQPLASSQPDEEPPTLWTLPTVAYRLAEAFSGGFAESMLSYLGVTRDPGTTLIPFVENLSELAGDNANQRGGMFRFHPLITFMDAAQASARLPIPNMLSDTDPDPSLQAWLSAYPCDIAPLAQTINIDDIMFNKTYQDVDLTLQESAQDPEKQNVLNTYVVPEASNFVDALMASLRLKFYSTGGDPQRLMYIPMLSPIVRYHPERRWVQNPRLWEKLQLKEFDPEERPPISTLVQAALSEDPQLKTDLFAAYQDPRHIPVLYKDLWWPKPELGIPSDIRDALAQRLIRAGNQLLSPAIRLHLPAHARDVQTILQHLVGEGESLWLFNPDAIFLLGDAFRSLLWKKLNSPAWTQASPSTPIESKVLQDGLVYSAHHLHHARERLEGLLAEFEDHPQVDALAPYLQAYLTGPIRSLVFLYETIWSSGTMTGIPLFTTGIPLFTTGIPHLNPDFEARLLSAWVPENDDTVQPGNIFKVGPGTTLSLAEGLRLIAAHYVITHLPKLIELADNPIPTLAMPAYEWMKYFTDYHGQNTLPLPLSEVALKLQSPTLAPALTELLTPFAPFLAIQSTDTRWQARVTESDDNSLNDFIHAAGISFSELTQNLIPKNNAEKNRP